MNREQLGARGFERNQQRQRVPAISTCTSRREVQHRPIGEKRPVSMHDLSQRQHGIKEDWESGSFEHGEVRPGGRALGQQGGAGAARNVHLARPGVREAKRAAWPTRPVKLSSFQYVNT